jgi:hypothetical protein
MTEAQRLAIYDKLRVAHKHTREAWEMMSKDEELASSVRANRETGLQLVDEDTEWYKKQLRFEREANGKLLKKLQELVADRDDWRKRYRRVCKLLPQPPEG